MTELSLEQIEEVQGGWVGLAVRGAIVVGGLLYATVAE